MKKQRDGEQLTLDFSGSLLNESRAGASSPSLRSPACLDDYRKARLRGILADNLRHSGLLRAKV